MPTKFLMNFLIVLEIFLSIFMPRQIALIHGKISFSIFACFLFPANMFSLSVVCVNNKQSAGEKLMTKINSFVDLMKSNLIKIYLSDGKTQRGIEAMLQTAISCWSIIEFREKSSDDYFSITELLYMRVCSTWAIAFNISHWVIEEAKTNSMKRLSKG